MNNTTTTPTPTPPPGTSSLLPSLSLNFGNGLIEIAALTTLIGSNTAAELVLGNRGAAGLVWGSITAFGASSVIRACASAASPGWLRQMLGLRTAASDKAVGLDLSLSPGKRVARRMRGVLDGDTGPLGVSCLSDDPDGTTMAMSPRIKEHHTYRDIYAFDSTTSTMLSELAYTPASAPPTIHTHYHYAFYRPHHLRFQLLALSLSLLKCIEVYVLFTQGGGLLVALLSGVPFLFALAAAVCLEVHDILASRKPEAVDAYLDVVAASPLPTTKRQGGPKKVVLGASPNPRAQSAWWKVFWAVTGLLHTLAIVLSYVLLGQQKTAFVFVWAGFQLSWLLARVLLFNLTENTHPMADRPMKGAKLESLPQAMKLRVANLVLGVGQYQAHVHPRNWDAYLDDSFSTRQIARLLVKENMSETYPLPPFTSPIKTVGGAELSPTSPELSPTLSRTSLSTSTSASPMSSSLSIASEKTLVAPSQPRMVKVKILAVIGDTALSSAAWMMGNDTYTPMDLYDSCIVVFEVAESADPFLSSGALSPVPHPTLLSSTSSSSPRIVAIPAARVFSARSQWFDIIAAGREDALEPLFIPRGAGSQVNADEKTWLYWVPCAGGEWVMVRSAGGVLPASSSPYSMMGSTSWDLGKEKYTSPSTSTLTPTSPHTPSPTPTSPPFTSTASTAQVSSVLGWQSAEIIDDAALDRLLGAGKLNISLKSAREVRAVVGVSREVFGVGLEGFLR